MVFARCRTTLSENGAVYLVVPSKYTKEGWNKNIVLLPEGNKARCPYLECFRFIFGGGRLACLGINVTFAKILSATRNGATEESEHKMMN